MKYEMMLGQLKINGNYKRTLTDKMAQRLCQNTGHV